jgi:hypothetical protein
MLRIKHGVAAAILVASMASARADDFTDLMSRVAAAANKVTTVADDPDSKLSDVTQKATGLASISALLPETIQNNPDEASNYQYCLKKMGEDFISFGQELSGASLMDDDDKKLRS